RDAGGLERLAAGLERKVARGDRRVRNMACGDAGALPDPRVAGVDPPGKIVVGHGKAGQEASGTDNAGVPHWAAMRPEIRSMTRFSTASAARRSAWEKANSSADP